MDNSSEAPAPSAELGASYAAALPNAAALQEVYYLTGVNPDGTIRSHSYWGDGGETAHKWGDPKAGTGAVITYSFQSSSGFTEPEQNTVHMAFALWAAVADVTFREVGSPGNIVLQRGALHSGAYAETDYRPGSGSTLGSHAGSSVINMETDAYGFDLLGSFQEVGGYGLGTIIHEIGHVLGLGHGGDYNGWVDPEIDQESAYDTLQWSIMSYIDPWDMSAKYYDDYALEDAYWGDSTAHTWMPLDILAIQQLYGAPKASALSGGQTFGFNSTVPGLLGRFFDFTDNTDPVVTLFSTGTGNTLDVSGFSDAAEINLEGGTFSSVGGYISNVGIAFGTVIETAIGGSGADTIRGNAFANTLSGGGGTDTLLGELGDDVLQGGTGKDTLQGGGGLDTFLIWDGEVMAGEVYDGGLDFDTLETNAAALNLTQVTLTGIESITTTRTAGTAFTVGSAEAALLVHGASGANDSLTLSGDALTTDQRTQIFSQGIERITIGNVTFSAVAPKLAQALADQSAGAGSAWRFEVPAGAFTDADTPNLTYTARLSGGAALPAWLGFDPATRTFTGTPPAGSAATLDVQVTASDGTGSASDTFRLTVTVAVAGVPTPPAPPPPLPPAEPLPPAPPTGPLPPAPPTELPLPDLTDELDLTDDSDPAEDSDAAGDLIWISGPKPKTTISDFDPGLDQIWLDDARFRGLGSGSEEGSPFGSPKSFAANASGLATNKKGAQVVYETDTGKLYYDSDGKKGPADAMHFATVTNKAALSISDFELF